MTTAKELAERISPAGTHSLALCKDAANMLVQQAEEIERLKLAPSWWRCDIHGPGNMREWGCPECVREMRERIAQLEAALGEIWRSNDSIWQSARADAALNTTGETAMTDAVRDALLPCPFCGGDPEFERLGTGRKSCIVACRNCGAWHESSDEYERCGSSWNTRAALAQSEQAQPVAWNCETANPTEDGWCVVKRKDGSLCLRCFGNGDWWIPLKDGWLSGIPKGFTWFGPVEPKEFDTPQEPPAQPQPLSADDISEAFNKWNLQGGSEAAFDFYSKPTHTKIEEAFADGFRACAEKLGVKP